MRLKKRYDDKTTKLQKEYASKFDELTKKEKILLNEQELLSESKELFEKEKQDAKITYEEGLNLKLPIKIR